MTFAIWLLVITVLNYMLWMQEAKVCQNLPQQVVTLTSTAIRNTKLLFWSFSVENLYRTRLASSSCVKQICKSSEMHTDGKNRHG